MPFQSILQPLAFSTVDWWIVGVYILLAASPGFLVRKYVHGQADFLVAGRTLSVFLATATLTATELGLVTVMYWAEFGFRFGFSAMTIGVISGGCTLVVGLTGFMVQGLRASGATTVAEYYEMRYSRGVRFIGGCLIAAAGILNYGVFLRLEAEFIRIITGVPDLIISSNAPGAVPIEIPSVNLVMSVLLLIVLVYTLLGGMVSVVVTDYIQFIVLSLGIGATTYWVLTQSGIGGFAGMVEAVQTHRPGYGLNPLIRETLPGGEIVGLGLFWIVWQMMLWTSQNTWQTGAFRTAATDSPRTAKIMWSMASFSYFGRGVVPMLWGIGALAFLSMTGGAEAVDGVDPQQAMPTFLARLPTGLVGFLTAGMLAALMSTHSSYLLAWSGVLTEDVLSPIVQYFGGEIPAAWRIRITRILIVCLGAFLLLWGLWYEVKGAVWGYLAVTGTMYLAGSMALMAFGMYWSRANTTGAYLALLGGALPGVMYLTLRIATLIVEPEPAALLARLNEGMTDPLTGILSYPLAILAMVLGSYWGARRKDHATGPRIGTGSFMAGGGA